MTIPSTGLGHSGISTERGVAKAVSDYMSGHTRGRLGNVEYRPEDLGLDKDDLRRRFAPYVERFVR